MGFAHTAFLDEPTRGLWEEENKAEDDTEEREHIEVQRPVAIVGDRYLQLASFIKEALPLKKKPNPIH